MIVDWAPKTLVTRDLELKEEGEGNRVTRLEVVEKNDYYGMPIRPTPILNRKSMELLLSDPGVLERLGQKAGEDAKAETIRILEEEGVTPAKVARRLNEALDAHFQEAKLTKDGEFAYSTKMVDNKIRLEGVKLAAEMLDMKEPEAKDKTQVIIIDSFNSENNEGER
jgi:hypothetical protein